MTFANPTDVIKKMKDPFSSRREKGPLRPATALQTAERCTFATAGEELRYTWLGHSSVLIQLGGKNILTDPVFSRYLTPVPPFGPRRFPGRAPAADDLPALDVVLISHNHYDHLDKATLRALNGQTKHFVVPSGIRDLLIRFGIPAEKITELNWNGCAEPEGLRIHCTPAHHNSIRTPFDADKTLWCSYVVQCGTQSVFYSGDTAFADHFAQIFNRFGAMDLALMECGQYGELWHDMHMFPEESVQACRILHARLAVPVHWGAYVLSNHPWDEPPRRFALRAAELGVNCLVPTLGVSTAVAEHIRAGESLSPGTATVRTRQTDRIKIMRKLRVVRRNPARLRLTLRKKQLTAAQ